MATEKLTILQADIQNEIAKQVKPKHLKLGKLEFKAIVEVDKKAVDELDEDARFVAKLYDDATKVYKKLVNASAKRYWDAEQMASVIPLSDKEAKDLDKDIKALFESHKKEVEKVTKKHFDQWAQANKDRKKYRVKVVGTIVVGTAAVAASTASLALGTVTGGVSIAASIYGIAQSVVAVAKAIKKIVTDLATVHKDLDEAMKYMARNYEQSSKAKVKAKEIGKEIVEDFLMVETAGFNRCNRLVEMYTAKLKNLEIQCSQLGKDLNKLLDQQGKLNKQLAKFDSQCKIRKFFSKSKTKLNAELDKCEKSTAAMIKDLEAWHVQLKGPEKFLERNKKALKALDSKDPTFAKWIIWGVSLGLTTTVTSIATSGENLFSAAEGIKKGVDTLVKELK